jgi:PAS domain S-box-containing protein
MFDWRELKRWNIKEIDLPPGSFVRYKELSFWELYRWQIIAVVAFCFIESLLILVLLTQRAKRRLAEHALKESHGELEQKVKELEKEAFERKATQQALQLSEQRLSLIYDSVIDVLYYIRVEPDDCFRFLSINQAFLKATGLTRDQIVGKRIEEVIPETSVRLVLDNYKKAIEEKRIVRWEEISVFPAGEKIGEVSIAPVLNEKKICTHLMGSVHEVTERKQAEETLRENEERYELAITGSSAGIWDWDIRSDEVYYSERLKKLLGYAPDEFSDTLEEFWNRMHTDDYEAVRLAVDKHLTERVAFIIDYRLQTKSGEYRWFHARGQALWDKTGKATRMSGSITDITDRKRAEIELHDAYTKIEQLKNRLEAESAYLQDEIKLEHNFENIIGQGEALKYVLHRVEQVATMDTPVLIMGETGTGKELMARALHELSPHGKRALVKVNCAVLPGGLIESELFGREKGAYTGATTTQLGRFELAKGSTLFLDEIGELPLELQAKLLRVLESGEFERLGSSRTLHSDARIIAATNRVLEREVRKGRFREDLWYRLKVFPITVPPLRERPEDIPLLVKWFVNQLARRMGKGAAEIPKSTMQVLQSYPWPGNVRELKHAVESALITAQGKKLNFELPQVANTALTDFKSFEEMECDYILRVLKAKNWRIGGENSAASTIGMHVNTLRARMKKLGIKRPKPQ